MTVDAEQDLRTQTGRQFVRFILVGLVNTAFGYAIYALLVLVGLSPQPSLVIAFGVGIIWNYMTHARLVFGQRGVSRLPPYVLCYLAILAFNSGALELALRAGLHPLLAQALLAPVSAILAFILISKVLTGRFPLIDKT